jgi:hypothetical protein
MSIFEIVMLICFGMSWPISIVKALRTRMVLGKSCLFMGIICVGYLAGILHKLVYSRDWIIALYALNLLLVMVDMFLYFKFSPKKTKAAGGSPTGGPDVYRTSPPPSIFPAG